MPPTPTKPAPSFPIQRGEHPAPGDWLSDEELREKGVAELNAAKMGVNVQARKLAIMQEHKTNTDKANEITRNRRR